VMTLMKTIYSQNRTPSPGGESLPSTSKANKSPKPTGVASESDNIEKELKIHY